MLSYGTLTEKTLVDEQKQRQWKLSVRKSNNCSLSTRHTLGVMPRIEFRSNEEQTESQFETVGFFARFPLFQCNIHSHFLPHDFRCPPPPNTTSVLRVFLTHSLLLAFFRLMFFIDPATGHTHSAAILFFPT